jgi:hypothetical protein
VAGWTGGTCEAGLCKADSCDTKSYYLNGSTCTPNNHTNCGELGKACKLGESCIDGQCIGCASEADCSARVAGWTSGTCTGGVCQAGSCNTSSYYLDGTTCTPNDNANCGELGKACQPGESCVAGSCVGCTSDADCSARVAGWKGGSCTGGVCKATSCETTSYYLSGSTCTPNDNSHCGSATKACEAGKTCVAGQCVGCTSKDDCSARVAGWLDGSCIDGVCKASKCGAGFEWNSTAYTCDVITSCGTNEYYYNGSCQTSSATKCGSETNDCTKATGWASGKCTNNVCVANACKSGYELSSGQCLLTSNYISCLGEWVSDKILTNMFHMDRNCNCLDNYMDADGDKSNGCESM